MTGEATDGEATGHEDEPEITINISCTSWKHTMPMQVFLSLLVKDIKGIIQEHRNIPINGQILKMVDVLEGEKLLEEYGLKDGDIITLDIKGQGGGKGGGGVKKGILKDKD